MDPSRGGSARDQAVVARGALKVSSASECQRCRLAGENAWPKNRYPMFSKDSLSSRVAATRVPTPPEKPPDPKAHLPNRYWHVWLCSAWRCKQSAAKCPTLVPWRFLICTADCPEQNDDWVPQTDAPAISRVSIPHQELGLTIIPWPSGR
ncbi:hypothetical protein PGT21_029158 [Puccinia graminis f. sp. tritici]|uniref:Uncharacterized protein n=1 Tax=Puccinia graminis f. sp. tritici TaxID=56615 RepID=A0A5B0LPB0_PUCGR|nr:hypothetical protein PGT21_029158 [Puccinia graminis f. sp. tritici]KAA1128314.1 hypothetical protein PGTUg99_006127 [Puccinia graminis f. sp. tritici]